MESRWISVFSVGCNFFVCLFFWFTVILLHVSSKGGSLGPNGGFWLVESICPLIGRGVVMGTGNHWPLGWWTGTGSHMTGTGSDRKCGGHVFWDRKPLTSRKKGWRAQMKKREDISWHWHDVSSGLGGKPLTRGKNKSWAQDHWGTRAQSPKSNFRTGGGPWLKEKMPRLEKMF